jgi:hypothetical protein
MDDDPFSSWTKIFENSNLKVSVLFSDSFLDITNEENTNFIGLSQYQDSILKIEQKETSTNRPT